MNDYEVTVSLTCTYTVEASDEETAKDIAYEFFMMAEPDFDVEKINKKD